MPNWLRALIAGYGAKKLGGGCFSTILIFIVIWYALGTCNRGGSGYGNRTVQVPVHTMPQTVSQVRNVHTTAFLPAKVVTAHL